MVMVQILVLLLLRADHSVGLEWPMALLATLRLPLLNDRLGAESLALDISIVTTYCLSLTPITIMMVAIMLAALLLRPSSEAR